MYTSLSLSIYIYIYKLPGVEVPKWLQRGQQTGVGDQRNSAGRGARS